MFVLTSVHYIRTASIHVTVTGKRMPYIILGGQVIFYRGLLYLGGINVPWGRRGELKSETHIKNCVWKGQNKEYYKSWSMLIDSRYINNSNQPIMKRISSEETIISVEFLSRPWPPRERPKPPELSLFPLSLQLPLKPFSSPPLPNLSLRFSPPRE